MAERQIWRQRNGIVASFCRHRPVDLHRAKLRNDSLQKLISDQ
jgi:hypothetical protein